MLNLKNKYTEDKFKVLQGRSRYYVDSFTLCNAVFE